MQAQPSSGPSPKAVGNTSSLSAKWEKRMNHSGCAAGVWQRSCQTGKSRSGSRSLQPFRKRQSRPRSGHWPPEISLTTCTRSTSRTGKKMSFTSTLFQVVHRSHPILSVKSLLFIQTAQSEASDADQVSGWHPDEPCRPDLARLVSVGQRARGAGPINSSMAGHLWPGRSISGRVTGTRQQSAGSISRNSCSARR